MDAAGLTIALINLCGKLYGTIQAVRNAPEDVRKLVEELAALKNTLESVRSVVASDRQTSVLEKLNTEIAACLKDLERLDSKICASSNGLRGAVKEWWARFKWPMKENETREYVSKIEGLKSHLMIALQAHQMYLTHLLDAI
jgi:Zn-dependent oligopeptidase